MSSPLAIFEITWYGHSCFSIYNKMIGLKIFFDPYGRNTGKFKLPKNEGDIVLCSHDHFDHSNCEAVAKWDAVKFTKLIGDRNIKDVKIRGVEAYHDDAGGKIRGTTAIYIVGYGDGIFVHLGDLGHILTDKEISRIQVFGRPHVLFVPVGGVYTIGPNEAVTVIRQINPKIAIPMHYYSEKLNPAIFGKLHRLGEFLRVWDGPVERFSSNSIEVDVNTLPTETTVYVLEQP